MAGGYWDEKENEIFKLLTDADLCGDSSGMRK